MIAGLCLPVAAAAQGNSIVYRCPGPPVLYTDALSAKEAQDKGCRTIEGAPITVVQTSRPKAAPAPANAAPSSAASRPGDTRIDPAQQKSRDTDARRILEAELRKEEERLQALQKEYNGGEPERRGDERNYQRYIDRVAEMKASISRKESDIAAIKRELSKLGS
ncbi:hypothetical protein [Roseateles toxinivorans]|uniref:hypothetical protein n=1 Tax=Roseateles toxinivorans TaxID=270368 RepID=UPI001FB5BBBD|nr:hypothetical protein [Roseateles toxinivorans]